MRCCHRIVLSRITKGKLKSRHFSPTPENRTDLVSTKAKMSCQLVFAIEHIFEFHISVSEVYDNLKLLSVEDKGEKNAHC